MTPEARNIYNAIQRRLRQSGCQTATELPLDLTEEPAAVPIDAAAFPSGLGDARMRFEIDRYFTIDCFSYGFDDSDAEEPEDYEEDNQVQDFDFVDPETLRTRPQNLSAEEAFRWDTWSRAQRCVHSCGQRVPSPAEIDYLALLSRLDQPKGRKSKGGPTEPRLLDRFMDMMPATAPTQPTTPRNRNRRRAKRPVPHFEGIAQ